MVNRRGPATLNVSNYIPFNSGKQRLVKLVEQRIVKMVEQLPSTLNSGKQRLVKLVEQRIVKMVEQLPYKYSGLGKWCSLKGQ